MEDIQPALSIAVPHTAAALMADGGAARIRQALLEDLTSTTEATCRLLGAPAHGATRTICDVSLDSITRKASNDVEVAFAVVYEDLATGSQAVVARYASSWKAHVDPERARLADAILRELARVDTPVETSADPDPGAA